MKKVYVVPAMLVNEAEVQNMMAVSIMDAAADPNKEVLTKENAEWNMWNEEE